MSSKCICNLCKGEEFHSHYTVGKHEKLYGVFDPKRQKVCNSDHDSSSSSDFEDDEHQACYRDVVVNDSLLGELKADNIVDSEPSGNNSGATQELSTDSQICKVNVFWDLLCL